jgi:hypothetical protein
MGWPPTDSPLRIERFSNFVQFAYHSRYDGMAPHDKPSLAQRKALEFAGETIIEPAEPEVEGND